MNLVGKQAPDFELEGIFNGKFDTYKLSDFREKWVILLFYPLDFTFVCPTEVLNLSDAYTQFRKLDCQIFGISVDSKYTHMAWMETARENGGLGGNLGFPLLADLNKTTARDYGVLLEEEGVALRGLFLIDPEGLVMHATINHLSVGRSVSETMRILKAFQFVTGNAGQVCPADWDEDKEAMTADSRGLKAYLSSRKPFGWGKK